MKQYIKGLIDILSNFDCIQIQKIGDLFISTRARGGTIFFAGNGGSAATASHFAQDIGQIGYKLDMQVFKTVCLNDSVPVITAIANDYGYANIFYTQLGQMFEKKDVLVVLSASGNSLNVVNAAKLARERKGTTVGLLGFDGGQLRDMCDYIIHIETPFGEYGFVEDLHLIINHMIFNYLFDYLKGNNENTDQPF